jgi:hypothetical protein
VSFQAPCTRITVGLLFSGIEQGTGFEGFGAAAGADVIATSTAASGTAAR